MTLKTLFDVVLLFIVVPRWCQAACENGWKEKAGHCYYVSDVQATWYEAKAECRKMGADLTSILNKEEDTFIYNITSTELANYWIGLKKITTCRWKWPLFCTEQWRWTDNSSLSYLKLVEFGHIASCASIADFQVWDKTTCNVRSIHYDNKLYPIYYICKKDASSTRARALTSSGTTVTSAFIHTSIVDDVTITNNVIITEDKSRQNEKNAKTRMLVIPLAVGITIAVMVIFSVTVICIKRKLSKSSKQPEKAVGNIYAETPVSPSAPPPEIVYENNYENVDNSSYGAQNGTRSLQVSSLHGEPEYATPRRTPRDVLEIHENISYEPHSS